jgi:hypothetical protein
VGPKTDRLLEKAERGSRLNQDEIAWLMISRNGSYFGYYTEKVREKYHRMEAEDFSIEFQSSNEKQWGQVFLWLLLKYFLVRCIFNSNKSFCWKP